MAGRTLIVLDDAPPLVRVPTAALRKDCEYVLTWDYWPHGGSLVRVVKIVPAKEIWPGVRGLAARVLDDAGNLFCVHPNAYLFECPTET